MPWRHLLTAILLLGFLWGCALPQVRAEERLFLNVGVEFRAEVQLPVGSQWQNTEVGGLSGLTYDPRQQQFYAISDDRQQPRFYTLEITPETITPKDVTFLQQPNGEVYPPNTADTEGIALTPEGHLVISSEGVTATASPLGSKSLSARMDEPLQLSLFPSTISPMVSRAFAIISVLRH